MGDGLFPSDIAAGDWTLRRIAEHQGNEKAKMLRRKALLLLAAAGVANR